MTEVRVGEMYEHLRACDRCARFDTAMRRGLLVARNLPAIRPSRDFRPRLEARLREPMPAASDRGYRRVLTGVAAGAATLAAILLAAGARRSQALAVPATPVATASALVQEARPAPRPASAQFMASLASGIPVWPGVSVADRAAAHLERVELRQTSASP
ncbi:MAG: hypothetical protein KGJ70_00675 [Gemmatimonadota bacterium]|nr:hypothetical protein [Gemmatimonadota bacterium]